MFERPLRIRESLLQPLDGVSALERMVLAGEAVHFDAAIVRRWASEARCSNSLIVSSRRILLSLTGVNCCRQTAYPLRQQAAPTASPKVQSRA